MQSCCFGFEQHRGRWAVFSAAFHHAERAPRVTSSLTAESPTIRSFQTILGVDTRTLATRVLRARKTRKQTEGDSLARWLSMCILLALRLSCPRGSEKYKGA